MSHSRRYLVAAGISATTLVACSALLGIDGEYSQRLEASDAGTNLDATTSFDADVTLMDAQGDVAFFDANDGATDGGTGFDASDSAPPCRGSCVLVGTSNIGSIAFDRSAAPNERVYWADGVDIFSWTAAAGGILVHTDTIAITKLAVANASGTNGLPWHGTLVWTADVNLRRRVNGVVDNIGTATSPFTSMDMPYNINVPYIYTSSGTTLRSYKIDKTNCPADPSGCGYVVNQTNPANIARDSVNVYFWWTANGDLRRAPAANGTTPDALSVGYSSLTGVASHDATNRIIVNNATNIVSGVSAGGTVTWANLSNGISGTLVAVDASDVAYVYYAANVNGNCDVRRVAPTGGTSESRATFTGACKALAMGTTSIFATVVEAGVGRLMRTNK